MIETSLLIALIVGLVEVAKRMGLQNRWLPLLAVVLGIGLNLLVSRFGEETRELFVYGIAAGLSSVGLFEISKHTVLGK